jgi:hypothetical protein
MRMNKKLYAVFSYKSGCYLGYKMVGGIHIFESKLEAERYKDNLLKHAPLGIGVSISDDVHFHAEELKEEIKC